MNAIHDTDTHHESVDVTQPSSRPHVLMVVANPTTSSTLGWPVGFWAAELFHPLYEFSKVRYRVDRRESRRRKGRGRRPLGSA